MDTEESLYKKYLASLRYDVEKGCVKPSITTQTLLAFYQEVKYRLSSAVSDQVTADQLLTYTAENYV